MAMAVTEGRMTRIAHWLIEGRKTVNNLNPAE